MKVKSIINVLILFVLSIASPMFAKDIKGPKGFNKRVFDASYALYATSAERSFTQPKFLCTVTAFQKYADGYLFLGAGHCTGVNPELPDDQVFFVATDLTDIPQPVELIKTELIEDLNTKAPHPPVVDYAVFYLKTKAKIPTIALGDESSLKIGSKTINVNFSEGLAKFVSPGIVNSSVSTTGEMTGFFGVQMFDSHGASGSSVIDPKTKKIVGLVIAGNDGATLPAWIEPISTVEEHLKGVDFGKLIAKPEIPKVDRSEEEPDYDFGEYAPLFWRGFNGDFRGFGSHGSGGAHISRPNEPSRPQRPNEHPGHVGEQPHHDGGRLVDRDTYSHYFGREHLFRPEVYYNGGFYSFVYAGIWFEYETEWIYPGEDVFVILGADGFYYMESPVHPGVIVQVWIP